MKSLGTIVAVGARTALGLSALETAFLLRTGIPALTAGPLAHPEGGAVTMALDETQDPSLVGVERAARLLAAPLAEIAGALGAEAARALRLAGAFALPEPLPGAPADAGRALAQGVRAAVGQHFGEVDIAVAPRGAAALAYLLGAALERLADRKVDGVLCGGVHTDYDPASIAALAASGRLFSPEQLDAVVPGEAAAAWLVVRDDLAAHLRLPPLGRVVGVGTAAGRAIDDAEGSSFDASALSAAFRQALAAVPDELTVGWAVGDHGFEQASVREVYAALVRVHQRFGPPLVVEAPAQRLGRLGAAALPLAGVIATQGFRRGYAPSPTCLAFAASDRGERGAILFSAP